MLPLSAGCTTGITEGVKAIAGGRPHVAPLSEPVGAAPARMPLADYERFELGELTDDFAGQTPEDLWPKLQAAYAKELSESELPDRPGGKAAVVRGRVLHYESKSFLGTMVSPLSEVIVRAEMVDKASGEVIARANLVGRTTSRARSNVGVVAEGLARAVVKWYEENHFPPDED
jgi:hypothetical protein